MNIELVTFDNYKEAIEIQKKIFPNEDGTLNILASLDRDYFMKKTGLFYVDDNVKYYIAKVDSLSVGITGVYDYQNKDEVWLAWYGILPVYRGKGYGSKLLELTIDLVKKNNYKIIRLYTDSEDNKEAIKLYERFGFIGEKYTSEKLAYDCWIYSRSLVDNQIVNWDNRNLNLSYQSELDQMEPSKIEKIKRLYDEEFEDKL